MSQLLRLFLKAIAEAVFDRLDQKRTQARAAQLIKTEEHHDFEQQARAAEAAALQAQLEDSPDDLPERLRKHGL
ncbi:hypothetical protein SAMN04488518_11337 [Pseudovibrio ascidiaceicola]|uniref:Uncharacterized protein n=1 Tax=Pseudovibrio ascidiaceicola TaxID=285279 RepID=A0A1I4DYH3_9HYPH|nr:hypothetical protein [Pseudovibrio ascidiaceicola]SFK98043.1 hypothetical protein SAMN04488518_11337 [Pseudovibrio ascidiaceicola]